MNWVEDYEGKLINLDLVSSFKIRERVNWDDETWDDETKMIYSVEYDASGYSYDIFKADNKEECETVMAKLRCCVDSFKISEYSISNR